MPLDCFPEDVVYSFYPSCLRVGDNVEIVAQPNSLRQCLQRLQLLLGRGGFD